MIKPNILFLDIDSLRADKFYGKEKTSKTPHINNLIKNGTYFKQAISSADATLLSLASMFTAQYSFRTGVRSSRFNKLKSDVTNFFEIFKKSGYHVYGYVPEPVVAVGLLKNFLNSDKSFDEQLDLSGGLGNKILNKLQPGNMEKPWIFYIHPCDLHFPIILDKEFDSEEFGSSNYERQLSAIDKWIGKFLEKINLNDTILIITSDHGAYLPHITTPNSTINFEANGSLQRTAIKISNNLPNFLDSFKLNLFYFLEKMRQKKNLPKIKNLKPHQKRNLLSGRWPLEHDLFDELVRVPLLFTGYNIPKGKEIVQQVRTIDIFPTTVNVIGISSTENVDGKSLVPFMQGGKMQELPVYIESTPYTRVKTKDFIGIRTSTTKYFRDKENSKKNVHLYDLKNDIHEDTNLANIKLDLANEMEKILQEIIKNSKKDSEQMINEEETKRIENELKKLGYI